MRIKSVMLMDSVLSAIRGKLSFSQWIDTAASHIAITYGKVGCTRLDVEQAIIDCLDDNPEYAELFAELRGWESFTKQKPKSEILAARMGGSPTIHVKRFVPKGGMLNRNTGILPGRKDRRK